MNLIWISLAQLFVKWNFSTKIGSWQFSDPEQQFSNEKWRSGWLFMKRECLCWNWNRKRQSKNILVWVSAWVSVISNETEITRRKIRNLISINEINSIASVCEYPRRILESEHSHTKRRNEQSEKWEGEKSDPIWNGQTKLLITLEIFGSTFVN